MTFQKNKKFKLDTEDKEMRHFSLISCGLDELESAPYCLQLGEGFNHLYSHILIDCICSMGGPVRIQDVKIFICKANVGHHMEKVLVQYESIPDLKNCAQY